MDKNEMAGVAVPPEVNFSSRCDSPSHDFGPAESPGNPIDCLTFEGARAALTSRQRRLEDGPEKDGLGAVKKLMEIHADPEADAHRRSRAAQFLAWQAERLAALSSAPHGEDGR